MIVMEMSIHFWSYPHDYPPVSLFGIPSGFPDFRPAGDQQCHWSSPQGRDNLKLVAFHGMILGMILGLPWEYPWEYHGNIMGNFWDFTSNYGNIPSGKR